MHQIKLYFLLIIENSVPVTYFYGFVQLQADGRAFVQTKALLDRFKQDGTYDAIKDRIISFVSDGAAGMNISPRFENCSPSFLDFENHSLGSYAL